RSLQRTCRVLEAGIQASCERMLPILTGVGVLFAVHRTATCDRVAFMLLAHLPQRLLRWRSAGFPQETVLALLRSHSIDWRQRVHLCRADEVVLRQAADGVRIELDAAIAVADFQ